VLIAVGLLFIVSAVAKPWGGKGRSREEPRAGPVGDAARAWAGRL